jgi:rod shape determining protein RodA
MNQRNTSISKGADWIMIWLYIALVAIGILSIFSVTYREGENIFDGFFKMRTDYGKQFFFFVISLIIGLFILLTDSKFLLPRQTSAMQSAYLCCCWCSPFTRK